MKRLIWDKLQKWMINKDRQPLIIKGARQVGKTYILKKFADDQFSDTFYLNFEKDQSLHDYFNQDLDPKRIIKEISFHFNKQVNIQKDILIFDEVQMCPKALTSLKYFAEDLPQMAVVCAGSLLGLGLSQESFPVGKVTFLNMYPLSFTEFLKACGHDMYIDLLKSLSTKKGIPDAGHTKLFEWLKLYFIIGGLPEVVSTYLKHYKTGLFNALTCVREKQEDIIKAYHADIAKHAGKQNAMHIERVFQHVGIQLAKEQNGSAKKFRFKGVIPKLKGYERLSGPIDWLEKAGLIIKCQVTMRPDIPLSAYTKDNWFKLYYFDVGLLGAMTDIPLKSILDYDYGSYKGYFAENYICQEFKMFWDKKIYCWKDGRHEVEFLLANDAQVYPIEVKSGWVTKAQSLKIFAKRYHSPLRIIMSAKNLKIDNKHKIHHYPLYLASQIPIIK